MIAPSCSADRHCIRPAPFTDKRGDKVCARHLREAALTAPVDSARRDRYKPQPPVLSPHGLARNASLRSAGDAAPSILGLPSEQAPGHVVRVNTNESERVE